MDRTTSQDTSADRRPRRRVVAVALAALLAVPAAVTLPSTPAAASSCPNAAGSYAGGDGSAGDPFLISTPAQLVKLAGDTANYDKSFRLAANIDLEDCEWTPIGTASTPFTGTFAGFGRTISGLNVVGTSNGDYGLFGATRDAEIGVLRVEGTVSIGTGNAYAGGLIGRAEGTLDLGLLEMAVDVAQAGSGSNQAIGGVIGWAGASGAATVTARGVLVEGAVASPADGTFGISAGGLLGFLAEGSVTVEPSPDAGDDLPAFALLASGKVEARQRVGGLIGMSFGSVEASRVRISGPVASTSRADVGGVIGTSSGGGDVNLSDVVVGGNVTAAGDLAGGILGSLYNVPSATFVLRDAVVSGAVRAVGGQAGGIIGYAGPEASMLIEDVDVSGEVSADSYVGGAIGYAYLYADVTLRRITIEGDVLADTSIAGGIVGGVGGDDPAIRLSVEDSTAGATSSRIEATAEGFVGGVVGEVGEFDYAMEVVLTRTTVRATVVAGAAPAGCLVGAETAGTVAVTDSFSRSTVTIGGVVTQCESPSEAVPVAGPSFVAPGGVLPSAPVGSGEWVQADGSAVPLVVSSPGRNQVRYVADGVQVTFTGGAGSDVSRGLVADQNGEVVCEICLQLAAGQVIEVWMFSEPRLVAAHLTDGLPCQRFSVPVVSPLDGGGPVVAGAHTLQLALPTASGMQAVNVGVTVGGPVPGSVPAGEGPAAGGGVPMGWLLVLGLLAGGVLASRRRVEG